MMLFNSLPYRSLTFSLMDDSIPIMLTAESLSTRIFGMYDGCDHLKEVPNPDFEYQEGFLNNVVKILQSLGRDTYISKVTTAIGPDAYVKVPAIRERRNGVKGLAKRVAFRALDSFYGAPADIRNLGAILYKLGDSIEDIKDPQVKNALEQSSKNNPYQHTPRMPLGTPICQTS